MLKKLFVGVLCVGLLAMFGTQEAKAWPRIGGWGASFSSFICDADLLGIGNPEKNSLFVDCQLSNINMVASCMNNGGGTGGEGNPFNFDGVTGNSVPITWNNFTTKGKAAAKVKFTDCDLYGLVQGYLNDNPDFEVCQNPNWSIVEPICDAEGNVDPEGGRISVLSTHVCITILDTENDYYFAEGDCFLEEDDEGTFSYDCINKVSGKGTCGD